MLVYKLYISLKLYCYKSLLEKVLKSVEDSNHKTLCFFMFLSKGVIVEQTVIKEGGWRVGDLLSTLQGWNFYDIKRLV